MSRVYTRCYTCNEPFPEERKSHRCRRCKADHDKKWRKDNPEKAAATHERWKKRHPEQNRKRIREWAQRHPKVIRDNDRRWREENPDKVKAIRDRRRARKANVSAGVVDYAAVRARSNGLCALCNTFVPEGLKHDDHILPIAKGGPHTTENLQLLCYRCNGVKGSKMPEEVKINPPTKKCLPGQPHLLNPDWTAPGYR